MDALRATELLGILTPAQKARIAPHLSDGLLEQSGAREALGEAIVGAVLSIAGVPADAPAPPAPPAEETEPAGDKKRSRGIDNGRK